MKRRGFLVRAGSAITVGAAAACSHRPDRGVVDVAPDASKLDWEQIRNQFALRPEQIHMAGFLLASHPKVVRDAIARHREQLDLDPPRALEGSYEDGSLADQVTEAACRYIGAMPDEVGLTDSTTMGLGILYTSLDIKPHQEMITTPLDHFSTAESLRLAAMRTGATVRLFDMYKDTATASVDEMVAGVRGAIRPNTRLLALTHVQSSTGMKIPAAEISKAVADINSTREQKDHVLFSLDGVHGFGIEDETVASLGCDFFIAGCHKWLFGPRGTGIVWGKREHWPLVRPAIPAFTGRAWEMWLGHSPREPLTFATKMTPGGFHSYEHRWALREAFDFHLAMGKPRVEARIHELNTRLKQGLVQIPGMRLRTPMSPERSAGINCFDIDGVDNKQLVEQLAARNITASVAPYADPHARLAPGLINSEDHVDKTVQAVAEIVGKSS